MAAIHRKPLQKVLMSQTNSLPRKLNLGAGEDYREGWHNVDIGPAVDPDEVADLQQTPWPWPSDHFERIEAHHILEHLDPVPWDELTRVLKPGGVLVWAYPIGHTRFEDSTHKQFWNCNTAEQVAGSRKHPHEVSIPLEFVEKECSWAIGHSEPIVRLYTRYRLWVSGPGPWLEQIPGLHGEVTATYKHA